MYILTKINLYSRLTPSLLSQDTLDSRYEFYAVRVILELNKFSIKISRLLSRPRLTFYYHYVLMNANFIIEHCHTSEMHNIGV